MGLFEVVFVAVLSVVAVFFVASVWLAGAEGQKEQDAGRAFVSWTRISDGVEMVAMRRQTVTWAEAVERGWIDREGNCLDTSGGVCG